VFKFGTADWRVSVPAVGDMSHIDRVLGCLAAILSLSAAASGARAAPELYEYRVVHSTLGDIGSYINIVERRGDDVEVRTELHVAVSILGIVVYHQEARRIERWQHDRLVSFEGVTITNGDRLEVRGEARDGGFFITTPTDTLRAPANVHPSNPWSGMVLKTDFVMSTRTGAVFRGTVKGGELKPLAIDGKMLWLRQYEVVTDNHQVIWLDDTGVPVAFRSEEGGAQVDFVLNRRPGVTVSSLSPDGR
jgi:hypothetical protein